ncbi:MAG: triphosphoribosyl-dephospho-CoA synthase [Methylococcaceae bacterium]|nr:triphosphoribosyl-dephospho-CoA synthase [Methylococcaceae bacterium]
MTPIPRELLEQAYQEACECELRAFKPGNVSLYSEGHDMTVEDFRRSARASTAALCDPSLPLGEKIFHAIRATREVAGCNTNLGIVLLAAPLIQAGQIGHPAQSLRENLRVVLGSTSRQDADWVYQAIRLASPGGLGESQEQDVREAPRVSLLEAMRIAEGRDRIAWQYTNSYPDVFDFAIPRYHKLLSLWDDEAWVAVALFVGLLKAFPDSHIERKFGTRFTGMVTDRMTLIEQALFDSERPERVLRLLHEVDAEFKSIGINPGTTADLTVTCLLAVRLEKLLHSSDP